MIIPVTKEGKTKQSLPVLKNVSPISRIGTMTASVLILEFDVEAVPGSTRIPMPSAESQQQVLVQQAHQVGICRYPVCLL